MRAVLILLWMSGIACGQLTPDKPTRPSTVFQIALVGCRVSKQLERAVRTERSGLLEEVRLEVLSGLRLELLGDAEHTESVVSIRAGVRQEWQPLPTELMVSDGMWLLFLEWVKDDYFWDYEKQLVKYHNRKLWEEYNAKEWDAKIKFCDEFEGDEILNPYDDFQLYDAGYVPLTPPEMVKPPLPPVPFPLEQEWRLK